MCVTDAAEVFATRRDADPATVAAEAASFPHSYICHSDAPVSAFGVVEIWRGVWSVWMFSTPALGLPQGAAIVRHFRRVVVPVLLTAGCHRVQCDSLKRHHTAHEFIERFGGRREAIMRGYGSAGEDFVRFAWDRDALTAQLPRAQESVIYAPMSRRTV